MFRKLFDEFHTTANTVGDSMFATFICSFIWFICGIVIVAILKIFTDFQPDRDAFLIVAAPMFITILSWLFCMLFVVVNHWLYFATNDKFDLYNYLFGNLLESVKTKYEEEKKFTGELKYSNQRIQESVDGTIFGIVLVIPQSLFAISMLLWYIPFTTITVGVLLGLTFMSRSIFRVSDKLVDHTNDPDAHKPKSE